MSDGPGLLAAARQLRASGAPFLVATVVRVRGSSYRRPGARLIAAEERRVAGSVSGGCLEKDLLRTGWWRTRNGPVVVRYDSSDAGAPLAALGCGGEVEILLERAGAGAGEPDAAGLVERALASGAVAAVATVFRSSTPGLAVGARWCLLGANFFGPEGPAAAAPRPPVEGALAGVLRAACERAMAERRTRVLTHEIDEKSSFDALIEAILPPPRVFVFGAGPDALPVVEATRRLGWDATVWEPTAQAATRERFAATGASLVAGDLDPLRPQIDGCDRALAVVMSHHPRHDGAALRLLLPSRACYIGLLGPRHRAASLASEALDDPRVHAPVGLDLGAETPEEIALAITAEMLASLRRATGGPLRARPRIHDPEGP